jgi:hypothetical protein
MLIKARRRSFRSHPEVLFNGQVELIISTDGKFLIGGKRTSLLTASASAATALFPTCERRRGDPVPGRRPDQRRRDHRRQKMGFRNATGQEVEIPVAGVDP